MKTSDVRLEISGQCARLSRECKDGSIAAELFQISVNLLSVATHEAKLIIDDATSRQTIKATRKKCAGSERKDEGKRHD